MDKSNKQTQRELGSVEVGEDNFLRIILEVAQHPQQKTHIGQLNKSIARHRMGVVSGMFQPGDTGWGTLSLGHKVIGPIGVIFTPDTMTQYSLQLSDDAICILLYASCNVIYALCN